MGTKKYILKSINVLNLILAGMLIAFINYMVFPLFEIDTGYTPSATLKSAAGSSPEKGADEKIYPPSPDYIAISEQNIFHPERRLPSDKKETQPLPTPEFVLYGTVLTGDVKIAYMEDRKSPYSTPGREKRQTALRPGETMSGYTLKEIRKDSVTMTRGEEKLVVALSDSQKPKQRESATPLASTTPQSQPQGKPFVLPPQLPALPKQTAPSETPSSTPEPKKAVKTPEQEKAVNNFLDFFRRRGQQ